MSGVTSASMVGVSVLERPGLIRHLGREREASGVEALTGVLAHHHDDLRLDDVELAGQERASFLLGLVEVLDAVRSVDGGGVDSQPLDRLQDRLSRTPEERDALVQLGRLGAVLEEEDVGQRVARADHGSPVRAGRARELGAELIDLGDRLLEVAIGDIVGCHRHGC